MEKENQRRTLTAIGLHKTGWSGYKNGWDARLDVTATIGGQYAAFCGFSSYHDNNREDRRFRFKYCAPADGSTTQPEITLQTGASPWDGRSLVDCPADSVLTRIVSWHNNDREDRQWQYSCSKFNGWKTNSCGWTNHVNGWDAQFNYEPGSQQEVIAGIDSYHDNDREDRRFKFKYCRWENEESSFRNPNWPVDFKWSAAGIPTGYNCIQIHESEDPHTWADNYFCWKHGTKNIGMRWSSAGSISNMRCTRIIEPSEPNEHTWGDNYLCLPRSSYLEFSWSYSRAISDKNCIQWHEGADPHTWQDNYLCADKGCPSFSIPRTYATPGRISYNKQTISNNGAYYPAETVASFQCPYNAFWTYSDKTTCQGLTGAFDKDANTECAEQVLPKNVALGKPTSQSSTHYNGGVSSRAVDGNRSGNWGDASITHTTTQSNPWWWVDLQSSYEILSINLYNRVDCCSERLANFQLKVLKAGSTVWTYTHSGAPSPKTVVNAPSQVFGDKVQISLAGGGKILSLAEVEVYASPKQSFRLLPQSFDTCPSFMFLSKKDCVNAGLEVGGTLRNGKLVEGAWGHAPFGCFTYEGDSAIHYNSYHGKNDGRYQPVCSKGILTHLPASKQVSCPSSMNVSKEGCAAAGLSVGGKLRDGNLVEGTWGFTPFGCFLSSGDSAVHYNNNVNGKNDGGFSSLCHELPVSKY